MSRAGLPATAAIVLAAGAGSRFGGEKPAAVHAGRPLIAHVVTAALTASVAEVVVVVGDAHGATADAARDAGRALHGDPEPAAVRVVVNAAPARGLSSSLRTGIDAVSARPAPAWHPTASGSTVARTIPVPPRADAIEVAVVLLADQPTIDPAAIAAVARRVGAGAAAARAGYRDGPGHPVAFARRSWPQVRAVTGDRGARDLLDDLGVVDVAIDALTPVDVDTRRDLDALAAGGPVADG